MRDKILLPPGGDAGIKRLARLTMCQDGVKGPLNALTVGKVTEGFSNDEALVAGAGPGELPKQVIGVVVKDHLNLLCHQNPPKS